MSLFWNFQCYCLKSPSKYKDNWMSHYKTSTYRNLAIGKLQNTRKRLFHSLELGKIYMKMKTLLIAQETKIKFIFFVLFFFLRELKWKNKYFFCFHFFFNIILCKTFLYLKKKKKYNKTFLLFNIKII